MPYKVKKSKRTSWLRSFDPFFLIKRHPAYANTAEKFKNFDEAVFICFVAFLCGVFLGVLAGQPAEEPVHAPKQSHGPGLLQRMFAPVMSVPGMQADGSFVFADFESASDFKAWTVESAHMEISPAHADEGTHCAKVRLFGNTGLAGIVMDKYFESRYAFSDWAGFRAIRFHFFNPESREIRLIFQVKDSRGQRFKRDVVIPPGEGEDFEIPLDEIGREIDLRKIRQMNFFDWKSQAQHEIYFDDLRLVS